MRTQLGKLSVGSTVYLNVDGRKRDFIIVNQGLPSSNYDYSCNGTWLLMKDIYEQGVWNDFLSTSNSYSDSSIHNYYLNGKFLELLDPDIQDVIKLVEIPCINTGDTTDSSASGSMTGPTTSGSITGSVEVMTKIFLLSLAETGISHSYITTEGSILEYFTPSDYNARIGYYEGKTQGWWLRSIYTRKKHTAAYIDTLGDVSWSIVDNDLSIGIRPAMILPSTLIVDDKGFVTPVSAPMGKQGSVTIGGVQKDLTGESYVNINGVWKPIVKSYTCIDSVWKVI